MLTSESHVAIALHPRLIFILLRFDYISRDCHAIGEKGNLSLTRLIHSARVIDNQLCYDIKDANQLYELCYTRFSLHKRIYNHKTGRSSLCCSYDYH
jgi:HD superfamily phosphohydrolase